MVARQAAKGEPEEFAEYERVYRHKRAGVLERFLARPSIFSMPSFVERFEERARENLRTSIRAPCGGDAPRLSDSRDEDDG